MKQIGFQYTLLEILTLMIITNTLKLFPVERLFVPLPCRTVHGDSIHIQVNGTSTSIILSHIVYIINIQDIHTNIICFVKTE